MPGTYTPLNEWCDQNGHRQFPLTDASSGKDVTGNYMLPQNFLVDMIMAVPPGSDITKYYVKSVVVRRLFVDIEFGYDNGSALTVGWARNIPYNAARCSTYAVTPVVQDIAEKAFEMVTGAVVIGEATYIVQSPGVYSFNPADTYLISSRMMEGLACVQSLQIGNSILTGNVVLQEGDNVRLDVDLVENKITISATLTEDDSDDFLTSDQDILDAYTALYGPPIVSIMGINPDGSGNFSLSGADCTSVTSPGQGSLVIANTCAEPCCDKSILSDVYSVLSQLNVRYAVLESYYQSLGLNLNQLQARLVGLELR